MQSGQVHSHCSQQLDQGVKCDRPLTPSSPTDISGVPQQLARSAMTGSEAVERYRARTLTTGSSQVNATQGLPEPARPKRATRVPAGQTGAPSAGRGRQDARQRCRLNSNRDSARRTRQKQKDGLMRMQQQVEAAEAETLVLQKAVDEAEARRHKTEMELLKLQHSLRAVKEDNAHLAWELQSVQDQVDSMRQQQAPTCQDPPMLPSSPYTFPAAPPHLPDLPSLPSLPSLPPQDLGWCSPAPLLDPSADYLPCSASMLRLPSAELLPALGLLEGPVTLM